MCLLLFQCWHSNKINAFNQKIYLEILFGLALLCLTRRFVAVVLNSQQINYLFSRYNVHCSGHCDHH